MDKNKRRAIVTGGAGFIGSHLVEYLLKTGYKVKVIDSFITGRPQNLDSCKNDKRLTVIKADIRDFLKIKPFFRDVDVVFHLAALADIVPSIVNPVGYFETNVSGTMHVIEASRLAGVKKFIYTASSSCYGIARVFPTSENAQIQPCYPYALTKYLGEETVLHWAKVYKMPVLSLRLFNVYGTRSRTSGAYGAVFGVFLAQKIKNKPFTVVGDGTQTRDFTFVTDVARAFAMAADSKCSNEIINVGTGKSHSINELVSLLGGEKVHLPKRPGEPDCTQADITKIKKLLGWEPRVSFKQGVKAMLDNIDYWKQAPLWTTQKIKIATKDWFKYLR